MNDLIIKTGQKTINKKVKALVKVNIKNIAKVDKKHVAGYGYVFYLRNKFGVTLGNIIIDNGQAVIRIKKEFSYIVN